MAFTSWLRSWKGSLERRSAVGRILRGRPTARRPAPRVGLEVLEDRTLLSAAMVNTALDDGAPGYDAATMTSLRDAINLVNADVNPDGSSKLTYTNSDPTRDEIDFAITAGSGYDPNTGIATIQPSSALPSILNPVIINGYTEGKGTAFPARLNTLPGMGSGAGDNAVRLITLDLTQLSGGLHFLGTFATVEETDAAFNAAVAAAPDALVIAGGNSTVSGLVIQNRSRSRAE